jgi:hypothetical protein
MPKRAFLVAFCCAGAVVMGTSSASASEAFQGECVSDATWSISLTSATASATLTNLECYSEQAAAGLEGVFPEFDAGGDHQFDSGPFTTATFTYTPIVGLCDGRLSLETDTASVTGVIKNDGNFHSVVEVLWTSKGAPPGTWTMRQTYVGVLQNACSSTFETKRIQTWADVEQ